MKRAARTARRRPASSPLLHGDGARNQRLLAYLRRRAAATPAQRAELDRLHTPALVRRRAVVFTDTADFTIRTIRDGILHFLMVFDTGLRALRPAIRGSGGQLVKAEADSLLLCYPDVAAACRGVRALDRAMAGFNRARPADERLHFAYGIGYGDLLQLEEDVFGLEVNLASKLGEDLAHPGEALLTPAAVAAAGRMRRHLTHHATITFGPATVEVHRLQL